MDVEGKVTLSTCLWGCKLAKLFLRKFKLEQPYNSAILLPFIHPKNLCHFNMEACTPLFTVSNLYNQSRYLSMDEGIKKKEYIEFRDTVESCSAIKSEIVFVFVFAEKCLELENIHIYNM